MMTDAYPFCLRPFCGGILNEFNFISYLKMFKIWTNDIIATALFKQTLIGHIYLTSIVLRLEVSDFGNVTSRMPSFRFATIFDSSTPPGNDTERANDELEISCR